MKHGLESAHGVVGITGESAPAAGPKAWSDRKAVSLLAGLMAVSLALLLYRARSELGFAALCLVSSAAGWLLLRRTVQLICLAGAGALAAAVWSGSLAWSTAGIELAVSLSLAGLAYLAAEGAMNRHVTAATERRLRGVTFLLETAEFLTSSRDQGVILNAAVHASAHGISRPAGTGPAHAAFHEVTGEQAKMALVSDDPRHQLLATGFEYPLARNQAALAAIRTGRPAIVRPDHLNGSLRVLAEDLGWQVLMMAPIYSGGSLRGLLTATARDGPAVDPLQQFMLAGLARFTSASLDTAAARQTSVAATTFSDETPEADEPAIGTDDVRVGVGPNHRQALEVLSLKGESTETGEGAAGAFDKLGGLISKVKHQAGRDENTGLLNREYGLAALEREVLTAQRTHGHGHCLAVLRVPAPGDANGGGELIRLVADRLRSYLRRDDLVFRYADDEIVCSFGNIDAADVQTILDRVQSDLKREIGFVPFAIGLTSVGPAQSAG